MEIDVLKLVADLGGLGLAALVILLAYKAISAIVPKFLELVANHFTENTDALRGLKDSIEGLKEWLKENGN